MGGGKGGGGGGGGQSYNFSQTNIPDWLNNASQGAVGQAQTLANRPYDPYTGQIVAQPGADTQAAYQQIRDMQGGANPAFNTVAGVYGGLLGQAAPITAGGVNDTANALYGGYQQNVLNPAQGLLSGYLGNASPATAQQVGSNAMTLMSPYEQAVINPALAAGQQQFQLAQQSIANQAQNVGAFGGSRQGVAEGVAQSQAALGTGQAIGNLLNQGWQSSLTPAYNLASQQSQQGYNAANLLAQMGQSGYNTAAGQAANIAQLNQAQGMTAASQLPALALQQQAQNQKDASLMQTIGAAQQTQQQQELNANLGQYYEQQNWPVQNLDMLLSAVGAVPYGTTSMSYGKTQPDAPQRNVGGSILGGAASGASTGFMLGGPWGAAGGAVAGGILGALN